MTSPCQRAAYRAASARATGPKTAEGKRRVSVNATLHGLSMPLDLQAYGSQIEEVRLLVRDECDSDFQALDLAKKIVQLERCEDFANRVEHIDASKEIEDLMLSPHRLVLRKLVNTHEKKMEVPITFTTKKNNPQKKERTDEVKFIEDFLKLEKNSLLGKIRRIKRQNESSIRYQKKAMIQLVKALKALAV